MNAYTADLSKTCLMTRNADFFSKIPRDTRFGIYLVHSRKDQRYYRLGASGVSASNSGKKGLLDRLEQHNKVASENLKDSNRTQQCQPWDPLWACGLPTSDKAFTLMSEGALFYHYEKNFGLSNVRGELSMFKTEHNEHNVGLVIDAAKSFETLLIKLAGVLGVTL